MKLAEALLERSDLQKDCGSLLSRITANELVQEGDEPAEDPMPLLEQYNAKLQRLQELITKINRTNAATSFSDTETIADAIARRDILSRRLSAYRTMISDAEIRPNRYSSSEIRYVRCVDPSQLQKEVDQMSKAYRELDMKLQACNWAVDLKE